MNAKLAIDSFDSLIKKAIKENDLIKMSEQLKTSEYFIEQKAFDSRLDYNITKDVDVTQSDLIYCTGVLYSLRPYINNPIAETINANDRKISTYFQNVYDSLYLMYASFCYEKLYNFWDRIGDKIATRFPDEFEITRSIMFANVIDKIKSLNLEDERISWLISFRENEFKEFNNSRRKIVHYEQLETKYYETITNNCDNSVEIEKIWKEKDALPKFFSSHIELTNKGIENAFMLFKDQ